MLFLKGQTGTIFSISRHFPAVVCVHLMEKYESVKKKSQPWAYNFLMLFIVLLIFPMNVSFLSIFSIISKSKKYDQSCH